MSLDAYQYYQSLLGDIPEFLHKYLKLDILVRLKDISLLCGMDYASKNMYNFKRYISRFDHSLNAALITWRLTKSKEATLACLFHDVSSPAFSHVVDYMNGDFILQESTEEKTEDILRSSSDLLDYLKIDGVDIDNIVNFKDYSVVDLKRPCMCADRLENLISLGLSWIDILDCDSIKKIIESITLYINEYGEEEIGFNDIDTALYLIKINEIYDNLTHSDSDTYMMMLAAHILKKCINLKIFDYDDLYKMGEHETIEKIEENLDLDEELSTLWKEFKTTNKVHELKSIDVKKKTLNPLINNMRLNSII